MKREASRFLAFFLVIAMLIGMLPMQTQAAAKKTSVKKVTLNYTQYVMKKGQKLKLKATVAPKSAKVTLKWKSSNNKVATVSSKGVVTAKGKKGKATITVTAGKKKATCKITIGTPVKKITASDLKLEVGKSAKINASISPKKVTVKKLTYKSNNTSVAKVSTKGKVTAVKEGKAKITITAADCNKVKKTITVTVSKTNDGSGSGDFGSGDSGSGSGDSGSGDSGSGGSGSGSGDSGSGDSGSGIDESDVPAGSYKIVLYDGARKIGEEIKPKGSLLKDAKAPYIDGKIFLGWYYDKEFTKKVNDADVLNKSIALYGNFGEGTALSEEGSPNYLGETDVASDFTITVDAHSMSAVAEDVKAALSLANITDPSRTDESDAMEKDELVVTSLGNGKFKISAKDGFQKGATYQLTLLENDKVPDLTFEDQTKDVVCYNFSVQKDELMNLSLDSGVKYLSASDSSLSANDAQKILEYAGLAQVETNGETAETATTQTEKKGTFTYKKGAFVAGDIVAVYEGEKPDNRTINSSLEDKVAYIEITEVKGTTYTYKAAEANDVLFTPDMIPIDIDEGDGVTGWSESGTSFTIESSLLDFTTGYEEVGLDYTTVVEEGDYVAFFTGEYGDKDAETKCYGKITGVIAAGETTTIRYEAATFEEILASMDLYKESELSEEQMALIDEEQIAVTAETQVLESGFAEEAGRYLAVLATETDDVKELLGDSQLELKDCVVTYEDGTQVPADELLDAEMAYSNTPDVKVNVSKDLIHFKQERGLRVSIAIKYGFDVKSAGSSHSIRIEMTAVFETEIMLKFSATGGAEWRVKWIFPYIYDYKMSGSIDQGLYTGIGITATAQLSDDDEQFGSNGMETEGSTDYTQKLIDLSKAIQEQLEESKEPGDGDGDLDETVSGGLKEKYKRFIEWASDEWIQLISVPLFETAGNFDPLYITAYSVNIDFVVSANLNMAIGMSFQYEKSQRNSFTLSLFHKKECSSSTIDLKPEKYQFDFYVMGRLGIRAGIRAKVLFGLFSTDIAGVGIQIEAGPYAKLWGYFYYSYSKTAGQKPVSSATGAVLIEIGAYIDLKLALEAMGGKFSYTPNLYSHQWPIWKVGRQDNVLDFAYNDKGEWTDSGWKGSSIDMEFGMVKEKKMTVPAEIFRMNYLDLKKGDEGYASYDSNRRASYDSKSDAYDDEENFFVEISEPAFVYNPIDNTITVNAAEGKYSYDGTMTITWKKPDCVYASKTISRTFTLNWIDPDAGKVLAFDSKGGTKVRTCVYGPGVTIEEKDKPLDKNMLKVGYVFGGWYTDSACTEGNKTSVPDVMPDHDLTLYAKWIPIPNQYTVRHHYEKLNKEYEEVDPTLHKTYTVKTGNYKAGDFVYTDDVFTQEQLVDNCADIKRGFEINKDKTTKEFSVAPDGSTVVDIYYKRQIHAVTYSLGELKDEQNPDTTIRYRFEEELLKPTFFMPGYEFAGWKEEKDIPVEERQKIMDVENLTYTATWTPNPDTPYYIEYYIKVPGTDSYVMLGGENGRLYREGETGTAVSVSANELDDVGYTLEKIKVNGAEVSENASGKIDPYGKLLIQYYYTGHSYAIHYDTDGGTLLNPDKTTYTHGFNLSLSDVRAEKEGYNFIGWLEGQEGLTWQEGDTPNYIDEIGLFRVGDIRLKADWRASTKELHLYDEDGTTSLGTMEATYGQTVPSLSKVPTKAGYDFAGYTAEDGTLYYDASGLGMVVWAGDKDINLKASWTSAQVEISLDVNGGDEVAQPIMATYKGTYPELPEIKRMGYTLLGWTLQDDAADNYVTTDTVVDTYEPHTLVAQWAPNTNTPYVIEFYVESVSQNDVSVSENDTSEDTTEDAVYYELYTAQTLYGTTGATVSVDDWKSYQIPGYTIDLANKESVLLDTIKRTGTTALKLYYRKGNCYTVTFTYGNGIPSETKIVSQGEFIDLPGKETANHMSMVGWSDGSVFYDASSGNYCVEGDVEFTALWEKETYQISYRNNAPSGSGAYEDFQYQTLTYDTPSKVMHNLFTITPVQDENGNYTKYYEFTGWNTKADGSGTAYQPGDELLNVTVDDYYNAAGFLYAQWQEKDVPEGTVPYYVMYNMEDTSGMYRAEDYLILFGKVGETTEAVAYEFENLTAQDFSQKTITYDPEAAETGEATEAADEENKKYGYYGYTVVEINYARDRYALNLDCGGGTYTYEGSVSENNLSKEVIGGQYIGDIARLTPEKEGYTFLGWDVRIPSYMPLHEINAVAQYKVDNSRAVTVEYYTENPEDDGYTLASSETVYAEKGDTITPQPIAFEGFETPEAKTITVSEAGGEVCQYYYTRKTYTLSWNKGSGEISGEGYSEGEVKYGAKITAPTLSREGYDGRWRAFTGTMPAQNITYRPEWKAQTVAYHVMYRMQQRTGTDTTTYKSLYSQRKEAKAGSIVTMESELSDEYAAEVATGYRKPMEQVAEIAGDGSTIIYFDYDLYKSYLSYDFAGGNVTGSDYAAPGNYYYGHTLQIPLLDKVKKQGCEVVGWYDTSDPEQTIISGNTITMGETDVTYRLKWERNTYTITYDLGEEAEGAENPNNPATYQTGCDFNIAGAVCEGMAFEGWEWAGDGEMPSGVKLLDNGLVHVTEDATGDISLKATWSYETRIFAAAMYDAQDAPVYTYHYPVKKAATLTLAEIAPPQREGYLFSYWTKKVPKEDYGYYTIILENDTKIADLNLNTDFVTACWMKIVEIDGKKLISAKDKREFDIALAYLKADPEYQGIYITGTINLGDMEKPILETWDEGYLLYGGGRYCDLSVQSTGVSLFTENRGEIKNVQVSVASARSYDTENGTYYGVMTQENYGKINGCVVTSGLIESDVTYLGGIAGLNRGTIENCSISSLKVMWNDVTASSSGKTLAYVGGIAGCNAVDGVIEGCHVNRSSVFPKSNYIKNRNPDLKMYMGGVAGTNQGRIEKCKVLVSKVGDNIQIYSDTNVYGYLCVGGIAGIDAQQGETNVDVRGIYKSDVVSSQVKSAAVAGGVIGESNYGMLAGNLTSSVTVSAVFGYAGQVAAIYRSNQYSQFWDRNIVEKGDTISKYGVVGFIALFDPTDKTVSGCEVVDIADMKSTFTLGGKTTGHNRGYAQYVCNRGKTDVNVLDTSYLEKKPSDEKKEEWVGDVGMSMD